MVHLDPNQPILARLDRLEQENRRYKLALGVATLFLFTWTACSLAPQVKNVVSAERFVLVAADGSEKGSLELDSKGHPSLVLRHEGGLALLTTNGPSLLLRAKDKTGAFMGIDSKNSSRLELCSSRLMDGVRLTTHENGACGLYVLDALGEERGALEMPTNGIATLNFRDNEGRVRGQFGIGESGFPNLMMLDQNGARRLGMILQEDGNGLLELEDAQGRPRAQLSTLFDGSPRLDLLREDGKASFKAP